MAKALRNSTVVVLGASPDTSRYSNLAVKMLQEKGFHVIPVHPKQPIIYGIRACASLVEVKRAVDTLTVYVNDSISSEMKDDILNLSPRRVIFNPGAENQILAEFLRGKGIDVVEACSLVLLRTNQF